ncbi:MAG: putative 4-hydroxybenzoate polyprenyltransferase [Planctomycetaceae bacterium]|jgi:4-hydroxybenzoate polyprenyltransferase|nr:putative 4-hydroxybenzoate polyprenyltransferase [Planctomycetaceae bacterium]
MKYFEYFGLVRFSHTLFAMPFALLSGLMGMCLKFNGEVLLYPRVWDWFGILFCMVFVRNAAMGFNRYADKEIDACNPRTRSRHIPSGILSPSSVLIFVTINSVCFVLSTLLFLPNFFPLLISIPLLLFVFGYSYAKRWTVAVHFWLGIVLMCAPIGAWIVVRPVFDSFIIVPLILGSAVMFWTTGFDLIYACQDEKIDAAQGLYSIAGKYGIKTAFVIARLCHLLAVILFALLPILYPMFSLIFELGVIIVTIILIAEHIIATPQKGEQPNLKRINIAFFQMNVIISIGLLIVGIVDLAV